MKKRCILLLTIGLILGGLFMGLVSDHVIGTNADDLVAQAEKECVPISAEELASLMTGEEVYTLIDVRQELEHYYGYIPGSVILPRGSLEFNIGSESFWESEGLYMPLKDEIIVVYCKKGNRGTLAAHTLKHMGYSKVYYLKDGFKKWELTYPDQVEKNLNALGGAHEEESTGGC
ncbi:MAG: rhodanese-like domain-containing protein [Prolixibacteraceae bacterium]|nr:rhodanese-like domain-containing protein [Prolixibacteraceae bacterium]